MTTAAPQRDPLLRYAGAGGIIGSGTVLALGLAFFGRGNWLCFALVIWACLWIGGPALVVGVVAWLASLRWWRRPLRRIGTAALIVAVVSAMQILSLPLGQILARYDWRVAQSYCEALLPRLEEYRQKHGEYSERIEDFLPAGQPLPRRLRGWDFYRRTADGRAFEFSFPGTGLFEIHIYDGPGGPWTIED